MNDIEKEKIIITYQGAFSPPTLGHKDGAIKLMQKAIELYPTKTIELKFMPSNDAESKDSLNIKKKIPKSYMSFDERKSCLDEICKSLNEELRKNNNNNHTFSVSNIEQEFTKIDPPITSKTICTLMMLSKNNPDAEIILGIGADNMANMIDWAHSLAVPYFIDGAPIDPITTTQLETIGVTPKEYYYKDYIKKIFVLDRTVNNGELVSNTPVNGTIDGIYGNVINITGLNYITSDSTTKPKPIPIVRTNGWGRTDVKNVTPKMIANSYGNINIYLLDPPLPENVSSSKVRNMIASNKDINELVPEEILNFEAFKNYVIRINKDYYVNRIKPVTTPGGGKRKKYTKKQKNKKKRKSVKKQRKYKL